MALSRRNMLIGLGGIVAGGGALVGTGAFTTVQAERTVDVETAGDANALLRLEPTDGPNGDDDDDNDPNGNGYAYIQDDTLQVQITGVNRNAITHIDEVFQITNNGTQDVVISLVEQPPAGSDGNAIDFGARTDKANGVRAPSESPPTSVGASDQPTSNGIDDENVADLSAPSGPVYDDLGVKLGVGDTLKVGVYVDTSDANLNDGLSESSNNTPVAGDLMDSIDIYASAEALDTNNPFFEAEETYS